MSSSRPQLETSEEPGPPAPRSVESAGYSAPLALRTWKPFTYAAPAARRESVRQYALDHRLFLPGAGRASSLPPVRILLIGGPASGKGTIAPMLSQAFRTRVVGVGQLLRGEVRAGTGRGQCAQAAMSRGELLPDSLVLELLSSRLKGSSDVARNGFLLDGFPRSTMQAEAILSGEWAELTPDCVVVLDRPAELVKEVSLGRMTDSATGQTFHPVFAPPPADEETRSRLVWRIDDVPEVIERRIAEHTASTDAILATFRSAGVPLRVFDNARSEIATFTEIAAFVADIALALAKPEREGAAGAAAAAEAAADGEEGAGGAARTTTLGRPAAEAEACDGGELYAAGGGFDVDTFCSIDEAEVECLGRFIGEAKGLAGGASHPLLPAVRRCNIYDKAEYLPVIVGQQQVGWASAAFLVALAPHLADGRACELVPLEADRDPATAAAAAAVGGAEPQATVGLRLAPEDASAAARTRTVAALVDALVTDGVIPRKAIRAELQDVRPMSEGFVGGERGASRPPPLRMERAAMIHFGIPSFGVHVNGYVRDPDAPNDPRPWAVWVGRRSMSKATYPGLYDQMVAGGQPAGLGFEENVRKECQEEASLPPHVVDAIRPAGLVSYRYTTRKGLSTKVLCTYDVELPQGMTPLCGDGEVEEFALLPCAALLASVRDELPRWKPNSAVVVVDFALRHGLIAADEPGYVELAHMLRAGLAADGTL